MSWLRWAFFALFVRPLVLFFIGLKVRGMQHLPRRGPVLLVANHNSHLDTMVLMSLFKLSALPWLRATAAADYWASGGWKAWFAEHIVGIVPVERKRGGVRRPVEEVLAPISSALAEGKNVVFFPEGTRGEPERIQDFKAGLGLLARLNPDARVVPVYLHGLGKAMPRGERLIVPHFCDVFIAEPMTYTGEVDSFVAAVQERIEGMREGAGIDEVWE